MICTDFLVIGAGIIGVTLAREIKHRYPDCSVKVIEKEKAPAFHSSGRNSGVLHAGFYYTADSLKSKFCRDGNKALTEYCLDKGLKINRCGKLVVATNEKDLAELDLLYQRGMTNGVEIYLLDNKQARKKEPEINSHYSALWSPNTASVDPKEVLHSLVQDALTEGIDILYNTSYIKRHSTYIQTSKDNIQAGYVINSSGLYADKVAHDFGFAKDLSILPFKGLYLYCNKQVPPIKTNIYPVPDLDYPFLGVHFTLNVFGEVKIGPTAIPAFWREQYNHLENFNLKETIQVAGSEISLFLKSQFDFRRLAFEELKKNFRTYLVKQAKRLIRDVSPRDYKNWGTPGIRAQLYDKNKRRLVSDFIVQGDERSFHVLNAVSPAFTSSLPFAAYCRKYIENFI